MLPEILFISFLVLLNAFFAMSEMAIVSASKPLLKQFEKQGKKSATTAIHLADNPGRFLSTVQVGITLVGTLAGTYGGATIAEKLTEPLNQIPFIMPYGETVGVILVVAFITYFSVVIGELVPKQLALNNAEKLAMLVAPTMAVISKIFTPIVLLLENSGKTLIFLMRVKPRDSGVTENEIKAIIAEGVSSGAIESEEHDVIRRVIRLGDRDVTSIMTHRTQVEFINIKDTLSDVRQKISEAGHSRYPVIDQNTKEILGIVKTKEILAGANPEKLFDVRDFMVEPVFFNEKTTCLDALNFFKKRGLHIAVVIDEYGSFEGLFTTADLMEAIVGMMPSNYDVDDTPEIIQREDGSWLVDGIIPIDEIHSQIGIDDITLNANYQTIAGFFIAESKNALRVGSHFESGNYRFEIVDMDGYRIDKILISELTK